jgi:hypothetical protein
MVVAIVFLGVTAGTIHKYLDMKAAIARTQGGGDKSVLRAIEALRAEIAALKQHESEAVLSFDSTLQSLDSRLKHVERRALGEGVPASTAPLPRRSGEETVPVTVGERPDGGEARAA